MNETETIASHLVNCQYGDIPQQAIDAAKNDILDTLGTCLAGNRAAGCEPLVDLIKTWGGSPESTILGYGLAVPCNNAVLANTTMAHALDYDDTHDMATLHAGITSVCAALAAGERAGKVSGKDIILAVVLGTDLTSRMGLATSVGINVTGFMYTSIYGYFGAMAAAGKIFRLNKDQMINAMGITYCQAAGNSQALYEGALTKRFQVGFAANGGMMAALLAQRGITGARHAIEGRGGIYEVYIHGQCDLNVLTKELGKHFEVVNLSFKPYPCCRGNHSSIDAVLALVTENDIKPEDIEEIVPAVGQLTWDLLCEPMEVKKTPTTTVDAQFSLPYTLAVAAISRKVSISDFTPEAVKRKKVLEMAKRVSPRLDQRLSRRALEPVEVTIKAKGKEYFKRVEIARGHPSNPMSFDDFANKFRECATYTAKPLSKDRVERVIEMLHNLEKVKDIKELISQLG